MVFISYHPQCIIYNPIKCDSAPSPPIFTRHACTLPGALVKLSLQRPSRVAIPTPAQCSRYTRSMKSYLVALYIRGIAVFAHAWHGQWLVVPTWLTWSRPGIRIAGEEGRPYLQEASPIPTVNPRQNHGTVCERASPLGRCALGAGCRSPRHRLPTRSRRGWEGVHRCSLRGLWRSQRIHDIPGWRGAPETGVRRLLLPSLESGVHRIN
jgi:hypothetical protein